MKFYIYTLGCKVNTYESNIMRDLLENANYTETFSLKEADIVIINTCSVTNTADKKSLKLVHHVVRENNHAILIVAGCSTQNKQEIFSKIKEIDIILGNKNKSKIVEYIKKYQKTKKQNIDITDMKKVEFEPMKLNNFNQIRAFIKIQDGCNNFCSYCIIPFVRGGVRSKELKEVKEEVETLVEKGHKEIVLTGIHTGNYGRDKNLSLAKLLTELISVKNLNRIRISSIEATELEEELLSLIKKSKVLVDHMHIPLQSGSNRILKKMNRKYNVDEFKRKIEQLRNIRPNISITTDLIVGFPGELKEDFQETIKILKDINFSKIHVFPYSKREGTVASKMPDQVDEKTKKIRVKEIIKLSEELETNYAKKFLEQQLDFIPEVYKDGYLIGHAGNYLPIKVRGQEQDIGRIKKVECLNYQYPYIEGKIV